MQVIGPRNYTKAPKYNKTIGDEEIYQKSIKNLSTKRTFSSSNRNVFEEKRSSILQRHIPKNSVNLKTLLEYAKTYNDRHDPVETSSQNKERNNTKLNEIVKRTKERYIPDNLAAERFDEKGNKQKNRIDENSNDKYNENVLQETRSKMLERHISKKGSEVSGLKEHVNKIKERHIILANGNVISSRDEAKIKETFKNIKERHVEPLSLFHAGTNYIDSNIGKGLTEHVNKISERHIALPNGNESNSRGETKIKETVNKIKERNEPPVSIFHPDTNYIDSNNALNTETDLMENFQKTQERHVSVSDESADVIEGLKVKTG